MKFNDGDLIELFDSRYEITAIPTEDWHYYRAKGINLIENSGDVRFNKSIIENKAILIKKGD